MQGLVEWIPDFGRRCSAAIAARNDGSKRQWPRTDGTHRSTKTPDSTTLKPAVLSSTT